MSSGRLAALVMYILFAIAVTWVLGRTFKPRHQVVGFLLCLWILGQGILNSEPFTIPLGAEAGFEIQFRRLLFLLFGFILFAVLLLTKHKDLERKTFLYERLLYVTYLVFLGVLLWHYTYATLTRKEILVLYSGWLTYPCFYLVAKKYYDPDLARMIFTAVLCVGVASAIVGFIQFAFDSEFLRVGAARSAFSGTVRSNGVFEEEYSQSYFLIPALVIALTAVKSRIIRVALAVVMLIGIVVTFHRMSWIAAIIALSIVSLFNAPSRFWRVAALALTGAAIVLVVAFVGGEKFLQSSDLMVQRLEKDTMSERVSLFDVALQRIESTWLTGIGNIQSNRYYFDMIAGGNKDFASGEKGGIHNLFVGVAYLYGVPTALFYSGFLFSMTVFFWRRARLEYLSYVAAIVATVFICANLTNWFYPDSDVSLLLAVIAGLAAGEQSRERAHDWGDSFFAVHQ